MSEMEDSEESYIYCPDCNLKIHANDRINHWNGARHKYRIRKRHQDETDKPKYQISCDICSTNFTDEKFFMNHLGTKKHRKNKRKVKRLLQVSEPAAGDASKNLAEHPSLASNFELLQPDRHDPNSTSIKSRNRKILQDGHYFPAGGHNLKQIMQSEDATFIPKPRRLALKDDMSISDQFKEPIDYKSVREKYRTRNTRNPQGNNKVYINSVVAYWAISLAVESSIEDFKISVNDKDWGDYGDAVVQINFKETKEQLSFKTTFAIQFKEITNNPKTIESLNEGKFAIPKYIKQINAIKLQEDVENKKFIVFTTAQPSSNMERLIKVNREILHKQSQQCECNGQEKELIIGTKTLSNQKKLFINTSEDNDSIFFFYCGDKFHDLPTIYLYTHQKKQKYFSALIDNLATTNLNGEVKANIHRDFVRYIENWSDGVLGGNYRLKKEDVLVKLANMLMHKYQVPAAVSVENVNNFAIWQEALNCADVTVLTKHPVVVPKICQPINLKIEKELHVRIDTSTCTIKITNDSINGIHNPILKMYMFEEIEDIDNDVPLDEVYTFFWKAGLIPMLLDAKDASQQEHILSVLNTLKTLGLTRRYFLLTPSDNILASSLRYYKALKFFVTLDDIASNLSAKSFDAIKITVSDRFSLSLRDIQDSDGFFQKTINAREFFDMSLGRYSFKPFGSNLGRRDGQNTPLILREDVLHKLREEIAYKSDMNIGIIEEKYAGSRCLKSVKPNLFG